MKAQERRAGETVWEIQLLGGLRVRAGESWLEPITRRKAGALLARLALSPERIHPREELIELLWPEMDVSAGRQNLRQTLHALRQCLRAEADDEFALIHTDNESVSLNAPRLRTDVQDFEAAAQAARRADDPAERLRFLEMGISLYRSELLPGYYEDWILQERERLHQAFLDALQEAAIRREADGDFAAAAEHAQNALRQDALREDMHLAAMRCAAAQGRADAVKRQFEALKAALKKELAASPSPEICALYQRLLTESAGNAAPAEWRESPTTPNERIMRRWFEEIWNQRHEEVIDEICAPDVIAHGMGPYGADLYGPEAFKQAYRTMTGALPDLRLTIERVQSSGEMVITVFTCEGTHLGDHFGVPATGKRLSFPVQAVAKIQNGKMTEAWNFFDLAEALRGAVVCGPWSVVREEKAQSPNTPQATVAQRPPQRTTDHRPQTTAPGWLFVVLSALALLAVGVIGWNKRLPLSFQAFAPSTPTLTMQADADGLPSDMERLTAHIKSLRLPEKVRTTEGERTFSNAAHARACAALAERAYGAWYGPEESLWVKRLNVIREDLYDSLHWAAAIDHDHGTGAANDAESAQRLAGAMMRYWYLSGPDGRKEGIRWSKLAAHADGKSRTAVRARALACYANLKADVEGFSTRGEQEAMAREAVAIFHEIGDTFGEAHARLRLGFVLETAKADAESEAEYERGRQLFAQIGDKRGEALSYLCLAYSGQRHLKLSQHEKAARLAGFARRSWERWRELGNDWGVGMMQGALRANMARMEEGAELRSLRRFLYDELERQFVAAYVQQDLEKGRLISAEMLRLSHADHERERMLKPLARLISYWGDKGQTEKSLALQGVYMSLYASLPTPPAFPPALYNATDPISVQGRALTLEQAIAYATSDPVK